MEDIKYYVYTYEKDTQMSCIKETKLLLRDTRAKWSEPMDILWGTNQEYRMAQKLSSERILLDYAPFICYHRIMLNLQRVELA